MTRERVVLLFDVDGTLVCVGGAGRRALEGAACAVYGPSALAALAVIRFDGMTDRLILREVCERIGRAFVPDECEEVLSRYVPALLEELEQTTYQVLAGVPALLAELSSAGVALGLGTGNIRAGAIAKLSRGGLSHHFAFGGFADDGESREAILQRALERAAAVVGGTVAPRQAIVVGDTPRDVEAARALGCGAVGVATGRFSREALLGAGAHRVFDRLDEPGVREALDGSERVGES